MIEVLATWDTAAHLGAQLPATVPEHRHMRRSGEYILIRIKENGLALFWKIEPGLLAKSS